MSMTGGLSTGLTRGLTGGLGGYGSSSAALPPIPAPTAGQMLLWRGLASTDTSGTVASGSPSNFSTVAGTGYYRKAGPRVGPDGSEAAKAGGYSLRVPYRQYVAGTPTTVFQGTRSLDDGTPFVGFPAAHRGMACGWFKISGCPSANVRLLRGRGYRYSGGSDPTSPIIGVLAKLNPATGLLTLTHESYVGLGTPVVGAVSLNEWFYAAVVWQQDGAGNDTLRTYYMRLGDANPTLLGESTSAGQISFLPTFVEVCAIANDLASVDPWSGAVGAVSLYDLTTLAAGALYPTDIVPPSGNSTWTLNAAGSGPYNFASPAALYTEIRRGTILGDYRKWVTNTGAVADCATAIDDSYADAKAWADGYDAGRRLTVGDVLSIPASVTLDYPIQLDNTPSVRVTLGNGVTVDNLTTLTGWTRPDAVGAPNVWSAAGSFQDSSGGLAGGMADGTIMTWVPGANFAAVKAALNGTVNGQYADAANFYIRSTTDPNSNGVTYKATIPLNAGLVIPGLFGLQDNLLVLGAGAEVYAGPMWNTDGLTYAQYGVAVTSPSGTIGNITVINGGTIKGGSKHGIGQISNGDRGLCYRKGVTILDPVPFPPGSDYYADVIYSGSPDAPNIHQFAIWRGCTVAGTLYGHVVSGTDPAFGYQAITGTYGTIDINNVYPGESDP